MYTGHVLSPHFSFFRGYCLSTDTGGGVCTTQAQCSQPAGQCLPTNPITNISTPSAVCYCGPQFQGAFVASIVSFFRSVRLLSLHSDAMLFVAQCQLCSPNYYTTSGSTQPCNTYVPNVNASPLASLAFSAHHLKNFH